MDKDNHRGGDFQGSGPEALAEKFGHSGGVQMLGHNTGAAAQHHPGQQGAQHGVADARPGGGDAVLPAELTGVAHEDHGGEIRGAVSEGCQPGPYGAASEHEAIDISGMFPAVYADSNQYSEIDD